MKIKTISLVTILFFLSTGFSQSQEKRCNPISTLIKGVYQSKNLYIQILVEHSVQSFLVNNKEFKLNPAEKAFEINLSDMKPGQNYEVKIIYCEGKEIPYKILNPEVLK